MQALLRCLAVVGMLVGWLTVSSAAEPSRPRNVLFIAADDLNCALGCYGDATAHTPHLDRLAARSLRFDRAYCQQAVCNPSRASILTGLRPDTIRVWDLRTDFRTARPDAVTLPQLFKQQGYHVQGIGKIFHNMGGLDDEASWSTPAQLHAGRHSDEYLMSDGSLGKSTWFERAPVADEAYRDGQIADKAVQALADLQDRPFFLAVGFWRPHLPFLSPAADWERYDPADVGPPGGAAAADGPLPYQLAPPRGAPELALHDSRELHGYKVARPVPDELIRPLWQGYYAGITYLDRNVGKVLDALDRNGLTDRTIVVFWSDHGYHLGQHGLWCKTSCYELDARVPLLLAVPGRTDRGAVTSSLTELVDVYPTLAELCGLTPPAGLEGRSLTPLLDDPNRQLKDAALTQHPRPPYFGQAPQAMGYSLRTDRYRYTEWRNWRTGDVMARELYDHQQDPHETVNVAGEPDQANVVEKLAQRMRQSVRDGGIETPSSRTPRP